MNAPQEDGRGPGEEETAPADGNGPTKGPQAGEGEQGGTDPRKEVVSRHRRLVARTFLVSALTLLSRLLGLVREMVMGALFGHQSPILDAFFTAFRVPNLFRRLFGEGALSTSLQAAITEADAEGGNAAGRRLFLRTVSLTGWILLVVAGLSMVLVAYLPDAMPGTGWPWLGADPAPVRDLTVRLMPFVVLVCLAALGGGALQVRGHYSAPNLAPAVMNVVWIAALVSVGFAFGWEGSGDGTAEAVFGRQWRMARWLAWGVLAGGGAQLLIHIPPLLRHGLLPRRGTAPRTPASPVLGPGRERHTAWRVLRTSAPLAFGAAVYQINVMTDGLMAEGLLPDGGPSALYFANRIQQFPLALVAISTVNAVFPSLKALGHTKRLDELRVLHDRSQLGIAFLAVPAAVGLYLLSEPIAAVLFQRGNFGSEGVARLADTLDMLALALVPAGGAALLARAYYACDDFVTPVRISCWLLAANIGLNVLLVLGLGMDADGLALATAITTWANLLWLAAGLRRHLGLPRRTVAVLPRLARVGGAAVLSGVSALLAHGLATRALGLAREEAPRSLVALGVAAVVGLGTYFALARLLGIPEWTQFRARVRRRLARRG